MGAVAFTPEILLKANWRYFDAPGTAGATYGLQTQETQIIAVRTSAWVGADVWGALVGWGLRLGWFIM